MWVLRPQELSYIQVWGPQALAMDGKGKVGPQAPRSFMYRYASLGPQALALFGKGKVGSHATRSFTY